MNTLSAWVIGLIVIFVLAGWKMTKRSVPNKEPSIADENDYHRQSIINLAQRHVDIINESLKIANDSRNADTKVSRLDVAKTNLQDLKILADEYEFITLTQLPQVEDSITALEQEFQRAGYKEAADGNMKGNLLEKEGKIDEAIQVYERLLGDRVDTPFTYRRLAIIYSKSKQREDELRVLREALENIPVDNSSHYKWFEERLAKKS